MSNEIKSQSFALDLKNAPDGDGAFEGYASVYNVVDSGMDVVERGAFTKSLEARKPKMLWQHDMAQPIGVWDEIREDEKGLFVKGRLLEGVAKGKEAIALLRGGAIDSMSIGYRTKQSIPEGAGRIRRLIEVDLFEISLVTIPMLDAAKVTGVKSMKTIREFEGKLRDVGFSIKEARAIAAAGFKGLANLRDEDTASLEEDGGYKASFDLNKRLLEALKNGR